MKINADGMEELFAEIAAKVKKADAEIRAKHSGGPSTEVGEVAARKFGAIGLNLPASDLDAYARSVEDNEPFMFNLQ